MKTNDTQIRIGAAIIVWSFLIVVGSNFGVTANAQFQNNDRRDGRYGNQNRRNRNWDNYGNYGGSFDLRQTALNSGYNEGIKDGAAARDRNRSSTIRIRAAIDEPPRITALVWATASFIAATSVKLIKRDLMTV